MTGIKTTIMLTSLSAVVGLSGCADLADSFEGFNAPDRYIEVDCAPLSECVAVALMVGKVTGLDYECDGGEFGRGQTNSEGLAYCPNNSTIRYFIRPSGDNPPEKEIRLGQYKIEAPLAAEGVRATSADFTTIIISPFDLEMPKGGKDDEDQAEVLAFLLAIGRAKESTAGDFVVTTKNLNSVSVDITAAMTEEAKGFIKLEEDITNAGDTDFADQANAWLDEIKSGTKIVVFNEDERKAIKDSFQKAKTAGVYASEPTAYGALIGFEDYVSWASTSGTKPYGLLQLLQIQNRSGAAVGLGLGWQADVVSTSLLGTYPLAPKNLPTNFTLDAATGLIVDDKKLNQADWVSSPANTTTSLKFTSGELAFNSIVFGSQRAYNAAFGNSLTAAVDAAKLGKWEGQLSNRSGSPTFTGLLTLTRPKGVLGYYFAPEVWRTEDTLDGTRKHKLFPMALTLNLRCDGNVSSDDDSPPYNCEGGTVKNGLNSNSDKIGIIITAEGNIITDNNLDCDDDNETNIGVVRAVVDNVDNVSFISLSMLWSKEGHGTLQGVELGTTATSGLPPSPPRIMLNLTSLLAKIKEKESAKQIFELPDADADRKLAMEELVAGTRQKAQWQNLFEEYKFRYERAKNKDISQNGFVTNGRVDSADLSACYAVQNNCLPSEIDSGDLSACYNRN